MHAYMLVSENIVARTSEHFVAKAEQSINKHGALHNAAVREANTCASVAFTKHCRVGKNRIFNDGDTYAWVVGQLVDHDTVPWREIFAALESRNYSYFSVFKGTFAFAVHFRKSGETFLVSDRCAQFSVYYAQQNNVLYISTTLSTFFACLDTKEFNKKWLSDYIVFNIPVTATTPLQGVHRMPEASVLHVKKGEANPVLHSYAPMYRGEIPQCSDAEMKEKAYALFSERIPKYYYGLTTGSCTASITSGFDSRLCLSMKPDDVNVELYTYGAPGCDDMAFSPTIAQRLGCPHHSLPFDDAVLNRLYELAEASIDTSGETLNVLRSTIAIVYEQLAQRGAEYIVTGIAGDFYYRGAGGTPHTFSPTVIALAKNPDLQPSAIPFMSLFKDTQAAEESFMQAKESFERRFAWSSVSAPERFLSFAHYDYVPKHWSGETNLSGHYVDIVFPYCDEAIRNLSYNSTLSTMIIGNYNDDNFPYWKRNALFASILEKHSVFKHIPIHGLKPKYYVPGTKEMLLVGKLLNKIPNKIRHIFMKSSIVEQENWGEWLPKYIYPDFKKSSDKYLLEDYIDGDAIRKTLNGEKLPGIATDNYYLGGKLVTAEMILRKMQ